MFTKSELSEQVIESTKQGIATMAALAANREPSIFSLRTRALKSGRTDTVVSSTLSQWIWVKCYASGGENALHAHTHEDHTFIILNGTAEFHGPDGEKLVLAAYEGITIPAGNVYSFEAVGGENLVMLRIGSPTGTGDPGARTDAHGEPLDAFVEATTTLAAGMAKAIPDVGYHLA